MRKLTKGFLQNIYIKEKKGGNYFNLLNLTTVPENSNRMFQVTAQSSKGAVLMSTD